MLPLAAAGSIILAREDRRSLSVLLAAVAGSIAFLYPYRLDGQFDRYLFVTFAIAPVLAVACLAIRAPKKTQIIIRSLAALGLLIAIASPVDPRVSASTVPYNNDGVVEAVASATPDDAIVVAQWNEAATLGYAQFVDHRLGRRLLVSGWPAQYEGAYPAWLTKRPIVIVEYGRIVRIAAAADGRLERELLPARYGKGTPAAGYINLTGIAR